MKLSFSKKAVTRIQAVIIAVIVIVVAVAGGLAYYYAAPPTPEAEEKRIIIATNVEDLGTLDPYIVIWTGLEGITMAICDNLIFLDDDMTVKPQLATEWSISPDGMTYTFKLRKDVKFTDGTPFNASCVEFSWNRYVKPEVWPEDTDRAFMWFIGFRIKEVVAVDDYTVNLTMLVPYAIFKLLSQGWFAIVSPTAVENLGGLGYGENPIGSGPYKLKEYSKGSRVVLERNDDYWAGKPQLDEVEWRFMVEDSGRALAMMAGDVDVINYPPLSMVSLFENRPEEFQIIQKTSLAMARIGMNCLWGPFQDVRVRQAMNHAVDIDSIIEHILFGYGERMNDVIPKGTFGHKDRTPFQYDPDKAKQLLADAGYPDGFEVDLLFNLAMGGPSGKDVAVAVQGYLADVGVTMKIVEMDSASFRDVRMKNYTDSTVEMYMYAGVHSWHDGGGSVSIFTESGWPSEQPVFYTHPEVEALNTEMLKITNMESPAREDLLQQMADIIYPDAPFLYLYNRVYVWIAKVNIKGMIFHPVGEILTLWSTTVES